MPCAFRAVFVHRLISPPGLQPGATPADICQRVFRRKCRRCLRRRHLSAIRHQMLRPRSVQVRASECSVRHLHKRTPQQSNAGATSNG